MAETLDTIFNPNANNNIYGVHRQPDRKTIIVGYFTYLGTIQIHKIARINTDGTIDPAFLSIGMDYFVGLVLYQTITQPDGKILVCGAKITGQQEHVLRRLNSNITLDTSFAPNPNGDVACIYLQADNKIMVGGWFTSIGGVTRNRMARLNSDGTVDTTFINCVFNNPVYSIQQLSDGKYLVGGAFQTVNGVARTGLAVINADGTLYTGFVYNCGGSTTAVVTVYRCADNKFLVAGYFDTIGGVTRNRIARFNADYTIDNTLNLTFTGSYVDGIAQRSNGDIYIGGSFSVINGVGRSNIAVINNDGTLSSTFNIVVNGAIADIIADNEDVTFVGYFTSALAEVRNYGARLASAFLPTGWCGAGEPWGTILGVATYQNKFSVLAYPYDMRLDTNYVYIAIANQHKIAIYDRTTINYITSFGTNGAGNNQFAWPYGIEIDDSYIYVADTGNCRVQVFNKTTYAYVAQFGSAGTGNGQFLYPTLIRVYGNYIYVGDPGRNDIQVFNKTTYAFIEKFGSTGSGDGQFNNLCGLFITNDRIYTTDYGNQRAQIFNKDTYAFIGKFGSAGSSDTQFNNPFGLSVYSNYIFIADSTNWKVKIFDKNTYNFIYSFGSYGTGNGQFNYGIALYVDAQNIWVLENSNSRIQLFNYDLSLLPTTWCGSGTPWDNTNSPWCGAGTPWGT